MGHTPAGVRRAKPGRTGADTTAPASAIDGRLRDGCLELGRHHAGVEIRVRYPLPVWEEEVTVGNPGFRQYRYRVTWKGDTVPRMQPLDNDGPTAWSEMEKAHVPVY